MDLAVVFGNVLRALRREACLTQEELALKAGVERNFISLIERGINQPTVKVIFKIAIALNTKPSRILALVESEIDQNS
ncbi:MAG: XRE family transcriptional regulator [Pedobacter sp.]|nr:MAG: XRE family transcriptional regulator [Pedobacter sp.]